MAGTNTIIFLSLMTLAVAKPIMVTFGTHQGPIEPPTETTSKPVSRNSARAPAPVSEETDDIPNPHVYRPPIPRQYRNRIYQNRLPPNLVLGTPIDQKYTPLVRKADVDRSHDSVGVENTGPHVFEKQEYEIIEEEKNLPSVRYIKRDYYQQKIEERNDQQKTVPQIGIVYSSGVRYYIPQLVYDEQKQEEEQENSVYDKKDEKYFYRTKKQ